MAGYSENFLKCKLNETQYKVTQESATEVPFQNVYWDSHRSIPFEELEQRGYGEYLKFFNNLAMRCP